MHSVIYTHMYTHVPEKHCAYMTHTCAYMTTYTTQVTIRVLDANDNEPEFSSDLVVFSVAENQTAPFPVGAVVATDMDEGMSIRTVRDPLAPSVMHASPVFTKSSHR